MPISTRPSKHAEVARVLPVAEATPAPDPAVAPLLARTRLRVDPRTFVIAAIPARFESAVRSTLAETHAPFFAQITPGEVSIVLAADEWGRARHAFPGAKEEPGYRLITLDVHFDWQVIGYLAAVTRALADAGVPVGVLSSFHHDHLLVRADLLDKAGAALQHLIDAAGAASDEPG